jgi:hypothetical protein
MGLVSFRFGCWKVFRCENIATAMFLVKYKLLVRAECVRCPWPLKVEFTQDIILTVIIQSKQSHKQAGAGFRLTHPRPF